RLVEPNACEAGMGPAGNGGTGAAEGGARPAAAPRHEVGRLHLAFARPLNQERGAVRRGDDSPPPPERGGGRDAQASPAAFPMPIDRGHRRQSPEPPTGAETPA